MLSADGYIARSNDALDQSRSYPTGLVQVRYQVAAPTRG
jgi:hypothetical protein